MAEPQRYQDIVNYEQMDPYKISASQAAVSTARNLEDYGYKELSASRGESSYVWDENDSLRAGVLEGLGTKNLVADEVDMFDDKVPSYYRAIAQDSIAMIVNDLVVSGAQPQLLWMYTGAGESKWFTDERRTAAFNLGVAAVCNDLRITWAGGESPTLPDIIQPGASEICGFALGEIFPKFRHVPGNQLEAGDAIVLIESNGIHANGISAARRLADRLPEGYQTELPDGSTFGETILRPTHLYTRLVAGMLDRHIRLKRLENITGHGWRKIMRAKQDFTYRMHDLPPAMPIFQFMQEHLGVDDGEMFGNYNMGAGFAVFTPQHEVPNVIDEAEQHEFTAWHAGNVEAGPKQILIDPLNIAFAGTALQVRQ
jgi:phosphoribosylformylglycinamidine cyclo-ligase